MATRLQSLPRPSGPGRLRRVLALLLLAGGCLTGFASAAAEMEAVTTDGRRVRLFDDKTWEFAEGAAGEESSPKILLHVLSAVDQRQNCVIGLRLENGESYDVGNIVFQFSAVLPGGTTLDTVFVGFYGIRPTKAQYKQLVFERVACGDIAEVVVSGGDRCAMGDLTKFSTLKGECLRRVSVEPSGLIEIRK